MHSVIYKCNKHENPVFKLFAIFIPRKLPPIQYIHACAFVFIASSYIITYIVEYCDTYSKINGIGIV